MGFTDQIKQLAARAEKLKGSLTTEEATKMSLIAPFFQALGYDVFNPDEFLPEFVADVGIKKGEKVDYAVMVDGSPAILIEAKWCGVPLETHDSQLFRYFATTSAKIAILTNGLIYKFYTDLDAANRMDLTPFLEIDILNLKENQIAELKKFSKEAFDPDSMASVASELKYTREIKRYFAEQFAAPDETFVGFFLSAVGKATRSSKMLEQYTPVVRKALHDFVTERMNEKISAALATESVKQEESAPAPEAEPEGGLVTTAEELEAFYIVRSILAEQYGADRIVFNDAQAYFSITFANPYKYLCRVFLNNPDNKRIWFAAGSGEWEQFQIDSVSDIYALREQILKTAAR